MVTDSLARQGRWFFRWRSYVLLGFAPLLMLIIARPEPIEAHFGKLADTSYEAACILLAFLGLAIRIVTVGFVPAGTSGRNAKSQIADSLNTTGLYSLTRNPLYLGNAVSVMAVALFTQDVYFTLLMLLFLIVYLERIIAAEESFLTQKFGTDYLRWSQETPAFLPRLSGWKRPDLPFSLRNVLKREYSGAFAIVAIFFTMDQSREILAEHMTTIDPAWLAALIGGAVAYLVLRTMKKKTRLLNVPGR